MYSGVSFSCEHLPLSIQSREVSHPLFSLPRHKLLGLAAQWSAGKLTHTENYLLYLSLLNSTELIQWRTPASYTDRTSAIVANNMEQLLRVIGVIDVIEHPRFKQTLPQFVVGVDTADLTGSYHWIQLWQQRYQDWKDDIKDHANDQDYTRREAAISKLIRSPGKSILDYPKILADWAQIAGDFPLRVIRVRGQRMEKSDYWHEIIIKCAKESSLLTVPESDLAELIGHLEDNLEMDSTHAFALMKYLRGAAVKQKNYLGLGNLLDSERSGYRILAPETSAEDANIQNMIDTAPTVEPKRTDYPSNWEYIKAKAKYMTAQTYAQNKEEKESS